MTTQETAIQIGMVEHLRARGWIRTRITGEGTGTLRLTFDHPDGRRSWVVLIEGNGSDLISDCGTMIDADLTPFILSILN
jgi:hypothetical protein